MRLMRMRGALAAAATVGLLAAGCSGGKSTTAGTPAKPSLSTPPTVASSAAPTTTASSPDSSSTPIPTTATPTVTTASAPTVPVGSALYAMLAPDTLIPASLVRDDKNSGHTPDTLPGQQQLGDPTHIDCTLLGNTDWESLGGTGATFAEEVYTAKDGSAMVDQTVSAYDDAASARAVAQVIGGLAKSCPSYVDPPTKSKTAVREKSIPGIGDEAYVITITSSQWIGGDTLELVRIGSEIIAVDVSTAAGRDDGAAEAAKLAEAITAKVKAAG